MDNVVEKIQKLLARATNNSNQYEAEAALLKARELMAKYKVSESAVYSSKEEIKRSEYWKEAFTSGRNAWFVYLGNVIAQNHCCGMVWVSDKNKNKYIGFVGLGNDPEIAREIFDYAVRFVHHHVEELIWNTTEKLNPVNWENSFGTGFAKGLQTQYKKQFAGQDDELALSLVQSPQVSEYLKAQKETSFKYAQDTMNRVAALRGFAEGIGFQVMKELPEGEKT